MKVHPCLPGCFIPIVGASYVVGWFSWIQALSGSGLHVKQEIVNIVIQKVQAMGKTT